MKVGVFDSGVGGLSVVNAIKRQLPDLETVLREDRQHLPYGDKPIEEIHSYVLPILQELVDEGCQVIVIACNTVTTTMINRLRNEVKVPLVGIEPAVKPAASATKTGVIAVCATPRTLTSDRYAWLKAQFAKNVKVMEPDCSDWALMIENNSVDREKVAETIESVIKTGADQIVLGCTHYHWIENEIKQIATDRAEVIQTELAVVDQLKEVLKSLA